uniref:NADH dehydrogenase subunit 3 n=1 Tax=Cryptocaryon irritans TaxID=153251 RepID=UPI0022FDA79A|nr:NADH dehydrogenase subunit 3 [Cryptocaryon irritans]WBP62338.1 NADH dehydrogenase subunit 3 [Cryptocaryon irritans]
MGSAGILLFLENILIFCLIFWFLTWAGGYFFKKKNHFYKKKFYECGFNTLDDINIQINLNFALICVFLILYDIEFVFIYPALFNIYNLNYFQFFLLMVFILLIVFSLIYDWQMNAMNWQY